MNTRQIEVFRAVMREGSLTAAARVLDVSQPALSQLLRHAEDQLGFRLFGRKGGRLVPTEEAVALFPEVDRLHREMQALRRMALDLRDGKGGALRFATSTPPALSFVPAALAAFRAACPGIRLVSHVVPVAVIASLLESNEADLGVAMDDTPRPALRTELIGQSQIVCLLPRGHALAARAALTPEALKNETLISYRPDNLPGSLLSGAFAAAGLPYAPAIEIDVSIAAAGFVQNGAGVALVDGLVPWDGFPGLVSRPFLPRLVLPVCLLDNARRRPTPTQEVLRSRLRAAFRTHKPG